MNSGWGRGFGAGRGWRACCSRSCRRGGACFAPLLIAQSQSTELHIKFKSGQAVVPIYEGWERVPDGSFNMVFGYLNRNHVEELSLPVGAQNGFEPGPADRGQPTYFYPRENHFLFRVNVPKDWDRKKELVWTITANGKTETARATLLDVWEIDRKVEVSNNGGVQITNELIMRDQPPVIAIAPIGRVKTGTAVTLSAAVTDDGLPGPSKPRPPRTGRADAARRAAVAGQRPAAVASAPAAGTVRAVDGLSRPGGRHVRAGRLRQGRGRQSRCEGDVHEPGTYTLRAFASDGLLRTPADVTVTVDRQGSE